MVKIISNERNDLIVHLTDLQEQRKNDRGLKALIETLTTGREKESEIDKDSNINLHVNHLYDLYHYTISLGSQDNQRREGILEILNPKLDALFTDVPKFFKDAFENRELYLYCNGNKDLLSFLKNNILLPIFHKDNGIVRECKELEDIIPSIKNNINEKIERVNRLIDNPPQQNYTEQEKQKLPFFELLKSMISPEIAQDEKYNYELLTLMINSKLELEGKGQSHFRTVQLKENKDLGIQDHRLGIDWNGSSGANKNLFSHVHPACLSEKEDYNSSNIKIKDENGITKTFDHFLQEYLEVVKERHRIEEITMSSYTSELYSHIFLAEDLQDTNSSEQKEHARLKLECKAPKHIFNINCDQNFFIRMAFEPTEELCVYKMTKEGRDEYHHNMIFYESSFKDGDYVYAADNTIEVTEITDSTYSEAMSGVCGKIIKQADQKSYLTMTMHLVPTNGRSQGLQRADHRRVTSSRLIPRDIADSHNSNDLMCDGQSSYSRIDITSNPDSQNLPKSRLKADSFKIQSINFDRVSALVANKELYQISTDNTQPVVDCIQAMQEKMNRITGNNLSNTLRPSTPPQSPCSTGFVSPLIGATGGTPQYLDLPNMNHNFEYIESNDVTRREPEESFEILPAPNSELNDLYIQYNIRRSK